MTSQRSHLDYIEDIVDAAEKAQEFMAGMDYPAFADDAKTVFATIRALEVMGEAANRIPADVQRIYPQVPWRNMIGMRNRLIHNYDEVDLVTVWETVARDVPHMLATLGIDQA